MVWGARGVHVGQGAAPGYYPTTRQGQGQECGCHLPTRAARGARARGYPASVLAGLGVAVPMVAQRTRAMGALLTARYSTESTGRRLCGRYPLSYLKEKDYRNKSL